MRKIALAAAALFLSCGAASAQMPVVGYESGPVAVTGTVAASTHASGVVVGPAVGTLVGPGGRPVTQLTGNQSGVFVVPIGRLGGSPIGGQGTSYGVSNIVTQVAVTSAGGNTVGYVVRMWSQPPLNTTCVDNTAFAGNFATDDNYLMTPPFTLTPAAPGVTTGDASTYASLTVQTFDFENPNGLAYVCLQSTGSDTADNNTKVRVMLSGPQN